jgi:6-phosphogluconolactonase
MKFRKSGQVLLAAAATVAVGLGMTSCGASNTVDYVYVTSNKNNPGQINVYKADSESGALRQIPDSPYPSGGRNPVAEVTSPNGQNLYVINHDDNTMVEFVIGTDGKLYPQHTCNTPGTEPSAIAISPDGTLLYVVDFYQAGFTDVNPGPGALVVYNIQSNGSVGTAKNNCTPISNGSLSYWALGRYPGGITVTSDNKYVYVADPNAFVTTTTPPTTGTAPTPSGLPGQVYGFASASGILTAIPGSPFATGSTSEPIGLTTDSTESFLFVTDSAQNAILNYTINTANGVIAPNPNGASTPAGNLPDGITVAPGNAFLYVSNYTDGTLGEYTLSSNGVPAANSSSPTVATGSGSTCVLIDPGLDRFVYTSNFLIGSVSSATLNTSSGVVVNNQNSPYVTAGQPTCVAAIPHNKPAS